MTVINFFFILNVFLNIIMFTLNRSLYYCTPTLELKGVLLFMIESYTRNVKYDLIELYYYYHYYYSLEIFSCLLYIALNFYLKFKQALYMENLLVRKSIFVPWYCDQHFSLKIWTMFLEENQIDKL